MKHQPGASLFCRGRAVGRRTALALALAGAWGGMAWAQAGLQAPVWSPAQPQRLSEAWLGQSDSGQSASGYWAWFTAEERERAQTQWPAWQSQWSAAWRVPAGQAASPALADWLLAAQPQGRVPLGAVQLPWLLANPARDPQLQAGDRLMRLGAERPVGVLGAQGVCWLAHRPQAFAQDYLQACGVDRAALLPGQQVWLIEPDAQVRAVRLASWAPEHTPELAPGALIWLGWPGDALQDAVPMPQRQALSAQTAQWLARLWPSPQGRDLPVWRQAAWPEPLPPSAGPGFDVRHSASNWGVTGLLQTPTARMRPAGSLAVGYHHVSPYSWLNVSMQPFDALEVGFRYMSMSNMRYGPESFSGIQSGKDKSVEVKARLWDESDRLPAVVLGVRDLGGTGVFGSEYLAASKRWGRWDASLGLGWGHMAGRADVANPLARLLGADWRLRQSGTGVPGELNSGRLFHGPVALFGGVQYQSEGGTLFKAELDGNNYRHEPQNTRLPQRSPLNLGLVKTWVPGVDLALGLERGNTVSVGLTLWTDLSRTSTHKLADPQAPAVQALRPPPGQQPDWQRTRDDVQALTDWRVERMAQVQDRLVLEVSDSDAPYRQPRLERAWAVLHRDAPADVQRFEVHHRQAGDVLAVQAQDRDAWVQPQWQPARTTEAPAGATLRFPQAGQGEVTAPSLVPPPGANAQWWPSLSLIQSLGGPDAFMLYQLSAAVDGQWRLPADVQLAGRMRARLLSNYDKFEFSGFSSLPRVRTQVREYLTTSRVTMANLYMGKAQRLSTDWTASVYGGYLEEMFAGVGSEVLYRQPGSRWALGADVNQVRQREFAQDFGLRDYSVKTGHLSLYWMTPWQNIDMTLQAGQYLAGDRGATLSLSRVFENGLRMGAFATRTNVSAQQFGEGSFNKGIFVSIPFDAFLTRSTRATAQFNWVPLTRDGGAALVRPIRLIDQTSWLSSPAQTFTPSTP